MLSTSALASARATATASLPGECTIRTASVADDGQGGQTETWDDAGTYPCRLSPYSRREQATEGRMAAVTQWQLLLPYGSTISAKDRVVISGSIYEVTDTEPPRQEAIFTEASVVRVA